MKIFNRKSTKQKRQRLRRDQTDAEKLLWSKLRNSGVCGQKFFRQYGIDHCIADFYCPDLKLVIEVDGGQHYSDAGKGYDEEREKVMKALGVQTLRFSNDDVLFNLKGVLERLWEVIGSRV